MTVLVGGKVYDSYEDYYKKANQQKADNTHIDQSDKNKLAAELANINKNNTTGIVNNSQFKKVGENYILEGQERNKIIDLKKMSRWDKIKMGGMNLLKGMGNVLKKVAGYDENGKWNAMKCLKNVVIAAATGAALFACAPLGAALAASGWALTGAVVTSIPAAVTAIGLGVATVSAVKNTKKAMDAIEQGNGDKFDKATQDLGSDIFIAGLSFSGYKSLNRTAGFGSSVRPTYTPAAEGSSLLGKIGHWTKEHTVGRLMNWVRNPISAKTSAQANGAVYKNAVETAQLAGKKWCRLYGFKQAGKFAADKNASIAKEQFEKEFQATIDRLKQNNNTVLADGSIQNSTVANLRKTKIEEIITKLEQAKTKGEWKDVRALTREFRAQLKDYRKALKNNGTVDINGSTISRDAKLQALEDFKLVTKEAKQLDRTIRNISEQRFDSMYKMSNRSTYANEVENFGLEGVHHNPWYSQPWHYASRNIKNFKAKEFDRYFGVWDYISHNKMKEFGVACCIPAPEWFLQPYAKNPAFTPLVMGAVMDPIYEDVKMIFTKEEVQALKEMEKNGIDIKPLLKDINEGASPSDVIKQKYEEIQQANPRNSALNQVA